MATTGTSPSRQLTTVKRDIELRVLSGLVVLQQAKWRRWHHLLSPLPPSPPSGTEDKHHRGQVFGDRLRLEDIHFAAKGLQWTLFPHVYRVW